MLLAIHEHAERFFQAHLPTSWVPDYLSQRGFGEDVQRQWRIGYAPNEWRALTRHLRGLGFPDTAIQASGLARRTTRGMLIDFFRDRAMFPITERDATTIAFIGRSRTSEPKYLNSPNTPVYGKGRTLFGLHTAQRRGQAGHHRRPSGRRDRRRPGRAGRTRPVRHPPDPRPGQDSRRSRRPAHQWRAGRL